MKTQFWKFLLHPYFLQTSIKWTMSFCGLSKSLHGTPQLVVWVNAEYSLNKILFSTRSFMGCYILIYPVLANEINIQWLRIIHQQKTFHSREVPCIKCIFDSLVKMFPVILTFWITVMTAQYFIIQSFHRASLLDAVQQCALLASYCFCKFSTPNKCVVGTDCSRGTVTSPIRFIVLY